MLALDHVMLWLQIKESNSSGFPFRESCKSYKSKDDHFVPNLTIYHLYFKRVYLAIICSDCIMLLFLSVKAQ